MTNSWNAFSASHWLWKHFPCKTSLRCLKKWSSVCERSGECGGCFPHFQFIMLLKHWLCNMWLGIVVEKNWAHSVDQYRLQALQFPVSLIDLLSTLLRCSGFPGIQKAVVDQTGSRPPNSDHDPFLVQIWPWKVLWGTFSVQPLSWSSPAVI